jgi:hypothetical protein
MYAAVPPLTGALERWLADRRCAAPVVVGGTGGSGTRLIVGLLRAVGVAMGHRVNGADDALDFVRLYDLHANAWLSGALDVPGFEAGLCGALTAHAAARPGRPWGWKNPRSVYWLPLLDAAFPGLRYLHVVRDGLDMTTSANQRQLKLHGAQVLGPAMAGLPADEASLRLWTVVNLSAAEFGAGMGGRYLRVRYEDACDDPRATALAIAAWLGIPQPHLRDQGAWDGVVLRVRRRIGLSAPAGVLPVAIRGRSRRAGLDPSRREALEAIAAPALAKFGYSL